MFSTFAPTQFLDDDPELLYGGTRAHNRAMGEFCADDDRLIAVGFVPLQDPQRAVEAVEEAMAFGCGAILVPSHPPRTHSPTHPDLDGVWARLQDAGVPLMLHVGGGGRPLRRSFHENGRPKPTDFLGGGENIRSKDYMVLHNPPEIFIAAMVLDGVFEKFPRLMCGVIEQGALWVPRCCGESTSRRARSRRASRCWPICRWPPPTTSGARCGSRRSPPNRSAGSSSRRARSCSSSRPTTRTRRARRTRSASSNRSLGNASDDDKERFYSRNFAELFALSA